jgi:Carboxypeptidase regulatory-like domain
MQTRRCALFLVLFGCAISAVATVETCGQTVAYENHNMVDYGPIKVSGIRGEAVDSNGVRVPTVCMALFGEEDHKFVAAAVTSDDGQFAIPNIKPGKYRLIAKLSPFCTANIPVKVERAQLGSISVQMRPAGLDSCSFGELIKTRAKS